MAKNITSDAKVSVVMSVYNGENYVNEAVRSILNQTFTDFEFIIIDDGSTDKTPHILAGFHDSRIKIITQNNMGLVASLNTGIKQASGIYIARQDADDRSVPDRLEKQVRFMEAHPEVIITGSSICVMNNTGETTHQHAVLLHDPELRQELLVRSPFAHGSIMARRDALLKSGLYNLDFWPAEDYELWLRLSKFGKLANLDDYLYVYRENEVGISANNKSLQADKVEQIHELAWQERRRLIGHGRIKLTAYKNLDMGPARIERIIKNISGISHAAIQNSDRTFALKNAALLAGSSLTYRKIAGKLKRRVIKP